MFGFYEWSEMGIRDIDGQVREGSGRTERERMSQYRARAYHPSLGRFMSEDPKDFDAGDYNLFRYCHNDPIDFTDPMGLEINYDGNSPLNNHNMSAMDAVWQRQMLFSSSYGAMAYGMAAYAYGQLQQAMGSSNSGRNSGLSFGYIGINQAPKEFAAARRYLKGTPFGDFIEWAVKDPNYRIDILRSYSLKQKDFFSATRTGATIWWNPHAKTSFKGGGGQSAAMVVGHEFDHAHRAGTDFDGYVHDSGPFSGVSAYGNREEMRVITGAETTSAKILGETVRTDGYGVLSGAASVTDHGP